MYRGGGSFCQLSMIDTRYSFLNIRGNHALVNDVGFTRCDERPTHASLSRIYTLFVWFKKRIEKNFQRRLCGYESYMSL